MTKQEMIDILHGKTRYNGSREKVLEDVQRDFDEIADYLEQSEKIVRCKDCMFFKDKHWDDNGCCYPDWCDLADTPKSKNGYCDCGERKDGKQDD